MAITPGRDSPDSRLVLRGAWRARSGRDPIGTRPLRARHSLVTRLSFTGSENLLDSADVARTVSLGTFGAGSGYVPESDAEAR